VNLIGRSRCSIQSLAVEPLITFPIRLQIVPRWTWKPVLAGGSPLSEVAALAKDSANTPFSEAELKRVEASLAEIRKAVMASQSLTVEKLDRIDANLEYLKESAERLGRKDWLNVAVSVVINIITTAAVPPDTARHILTVAGTVLNWVLGGSPLLPHPLQ